MIEIVEEKIDGSTIRVRKINWTYFNKEDLEKLRIRMLEELDQVNLILEMYNA